MTQIIEIRTPEVVVVNDTTLEIIEVAIQGPAGPPGPPGPPASGDVSDYLQTALRLAEFDDETKRAAARANLGIETWDGGTF